MRNRNAVKRVGQNFAAAIVVMILAACGQNPGGNYGTAEPIQPAMASEGVQSFDLVIPLDAAVADSNPTRFAVRGRYLAIDPRSTGQANLFLNTTADVPRLVYPGTSFTQDFNDLYFSWAAQPGKFIHVIYGDSPDILTFGNKTAIDPAVIGTAFEYTSNFVSDNAAHAIVTAAQNVNGVKILSGRLASVANSNGGATQNLVNSSLRYANPAGQWVYLDTVYSLSIVNTSWPIAQTLDIKPVTIPPGCALQLFNFDNGFTPNHSLILNYQVL